VALDLARGAAVTLLGVVVLGALLPALPTALPTGWGRLAAGLAAAAAVASSIRLFGTRRLGWFAAGATAGALLLVAR
jgi:hypothetical protein